MDEHTQNKLFSLIPSLAPFIETEDTKADSLFGNTGSLLRSGDQPLASVPHGHPLRSNLILWLSGMRYFLESSPVTVNTMLLTSVWRHNSENASH